MLNCICEGMKKIKILLLSLLPAVGLCAQNPLLVLEAEDAVLTPPVKVKYVNGYSGDAYVGDNDSGSEILFRNVYEYVHSFHSRSNGILCTGGDRYDGDDRRLEPPSGRYDAFVYLSR